MKTPREVLFERHRQAEPRLDAVRRDVLAALPMAESVDRAHLETSHGLDVAPTGSPFRRPSFQKGTLRFHHALSRLEVGAPALLRKAWLELIWPSRRAWTAMAVLWLVLLAANLQMKAVFGPVPAVRPAPAGELAQALDEQRRLLAELLPPLGPPPAAPARPNAGRRSERPATFKAC